MRPRQLDLILELNPECFATERLRAGFRQRAAAHWQAVTEHKQTHHTEHLCEELRAAPHCIAFEYVPTVRSTLSDVCITREASMYLHVHESRIFTSGTLFRSLACSCRVTGSALERRTVILARRRAIAHSTDCSTSPKAAWNRCCKMRTGPNPTPSRRTSRGGTA
jgi:hypothetical protein